MTVDVPMQRRPIANWGLIGATCLLSLTMLFRIDAMPFWRALPLSRGEFAPGQLVSYLFVHVGIFHLVTNMVFLFCFGNAVNARLGHGLFLLLYLVLGVLAGVGWLLFGSGGACAGASGAIMGLVGVYVAYYPRNDVRMFYWVPYVAPGSVGTFRVSSWWVIAAYFALDFWGMTHTATNHVAYTAHVAGAAAGFLIALGLLRWAIVPSGDAEESVLDVIRGSGRPSRRAARLATRRPEGRRHGSR